MATSTNTDGLYTRIKKANSTKEIALILEAGSSYKLAAPGYMTKLKGLAKRRSRELKKS